MRTIYKAVHTINDIDFYDRNGEQIEYTIGYFERPSSAAVKLILFARTNEIEHNELDLLNLKIGQWWVDTGEVVDDPAAHDDRYFALSIQPVEVN